MLQTQSAKLTAAGLCAAVTILFWAGSFPAITLGLTGFDPLPLAAFRFLIASVALFGLVLFRNGGPTLPTVRDAAWFLFCGALGIAIYNCLLNTGQKTVSPAAASFLIACQPVFAAIVAIVFFRQRFGRAGWIGTGISLGGAAIIATGQPGGMDLGAGAPLILMASVCSGAFFAFQRPLIARYGPLVSSFWTLLAGAVLLSPWAVWGLDQFGTAPPSALMALAFLGLFPGALAYVTWMVAIDGFGAPKAANLLFFMAPVASLLSIPLVGMWPNWTTILGGAFAIVGVSIVHKSR
ncbi:DMT family transporter [Puniceibacterium sp. IMCC21224]|uniref:DMT family transporter n=1 Tax=Puniceibacterium sp. IMCC21224 TaxID=1618204 RepID=UPI00064DD2F7|nr:DMT family transporter [Puniceibacterium sp. IMCC21224]KMK64627.1 EamA-like transporter family [Puniceibacterium sp. IMCC21224]